MAFNFSQPYVVLTVIYKPTGEIRKIKDYRYDSRIHEIVKKSDYVDRQAKPQDLVANAVTKELARQKVALAPISTTSTTSTNVEAFRINGGEAVFDGTLTEIEIIDVPVKKAKKKRVTRKKKSS